VNVVVEDAKGVGVDGVETIVPGNSAEVIEAGPANARSVEGIHDVREFVVIRGRNTGVVVLGAQGEVVVHVVADSSSGDELSAELTVETKGVPVDTTERMVVNVKVSHALREFVEVFREGAEAELVAEGRDLAGIRGIEEVSVRGPL
ncbi:hypothetical protein B0H13DRAFT_2331019, partial [Mycena leptocephala]